MAATDVRDGAEELLRLAYPDERERELIAGRLAVAGSLTGPKAAVSWWGVIPRVRYGRLALMCALAWGVVSGLLGERAGGDSWGVSVGLFSLFFMLGALIKPGKNGRVKAPRHTDSPRAAYRAARRACWIGAAGIVIPVAVLAGIGWWNWPPALIFFGTLFAATADCWYLRATLADLVLAVQCRRLVRTQRLLDDAFQQGLLRPAGARYEFCNPALPAYLVSLAERNQPQRQEVQPDSIRGRLASKLSGEATVRLSTDLGTATGGFVLALGVLAAGRPGCSSWQSSFSQGGMDLCLVPVIAAGWGARFIMERKAGRTAPVPSPGGRKRKRRMSRTALAVLLAGFAGTITMLLTVGANIIGLGNDQTMCGSRWGEDAGAIVLSGMAGLTVCYLAILALRGAEKWASAPPPARRHRAGLVALLTVAALCALVIWPDRVWAGLMTGLGLVLPAACMLTCGVWAYRLVRLHAGSSWWRYLADGLLAAAAGFAFFLLADRTVFGVMPALGLLFPVMIWLAIRMWRALNGSAVLAVRASADVVFSLLTGAVLVLVLVWLANMLDLPPAEVAVLRAVLSAVGRFADVPWWVWFVLYSGLAGCSLLLAKRSGQFDRLRRLMKATPSLNVARRILTGGHLALLLILLIGMIAPAAGLSVRAKLRAVYTEAYDTRLIAYSQTITYHEIARQFPANPAGYAPLIAVFSEIHDLSAPDDKDGNASGTELDLARMVGQLQASTLTTSETQTPAGKPAEEAASNAAGEAAGRDAAQGGLDEGLGKLDTEENNEDEEEDQADQAGDLAAIAISRAIIIPGIGGHELGEIVTEYLSGLLENSALKEVLADWARKFTDKTEEGNDDNNEPIPVAELVVPDPQRLEAAAVAVLASDLAVTPVADPGKAHQDLQNLVQHESPAQAAVTLTNQARFLSADTGPCPGCVQPEEPAGNLPPPGDSDQPTDEGGGGGD